ncbi:MAG: ABC transporter permease subunit [Thermomicrobiales bacterium]
MSTFSGDLDCSLINFRPVSDRILEVIPNTLLLSGLSLIISLLIAVPLGIYAAVHRNSIADRVINVLAVAGYAVPTVWLGLLLIHRLLPSSSGKVGVLHTAGRYSRPRSFVVAVASGTELNTSSCRLRRW